MAKNHPSGSITRTGYADITYVLLLFGVLLVSKLRGTLLWSWAWVASFPLWGTALIAASRTLFDGMNDGRSGGKEGE